MDISYLLFLQDLRVATQDVFSDFLLFITKFGESPFLFATFLSIYWCFSKELGKKLIFANVFTGFINGILKLMACVYRPWIRDTRIEPYGDAKVQATGYSFPSGHSTAVTSVFGYLVYLFRKKKALCISLASVVLLVLFSRNYLGVHTPQDVVCGFLTSVVSIILLELMFRWEAKKEGRDIIIVVISTIIAVLAIMFVLFKSYPIDYTESGALLVDPHNMQIDFFKFVSLFVGVVYGLFIEKRWIRFTIPQEYTTKMARFIPGMMITMFMYYAFANIIKFVLPKEIAIVIAFLFIGLFITAIYPYIFKKIENKKKA